MNCSKIIQYFNCRLSLREALFVVGHLHLHIVVPSLNGFLVGMLFESIVVVWTNAVLVAPEHSQERPIHSVFSLPLPALFEYFFHSCVRNSFWYLWKSNLSELFAEVLASLLLVVDGQLFKDVDDPLVVTWTDVNVMLSKFIYFFFCNFVGLLAEAPTFFHCVLLFLVHRLYVFHIMIWNFSAFLAQLFVLQKMFWVLQLDVREHIWYLFNNIRWNNNLCLLVFNLVTSRIIVHITCLFGLDGVIYDHLLILLLIILCLTFGFLFPLRIHYSWNININLRKFVVVVDYCFCFVFLVVGSLVSFDVSHYLQLLVAVHLTCTGVVSSILCHWLYFAYLFGVL